MKPDSIVVLGLGNLLLSDEGVGVRVVTFLEERTPPSADINFMDGGTLGFNLLPDLEKAGALIVVDAAFLSAPAGAVQVFEGGQMDEFLRNRSRSPHDIGLDDLMDALRLRERLPANRALVAIQPAVLNPGDKLSAAVQAALPVAAGKVNDLIRRWLV